MESKGFQVLSNLLKEPLRENLNLSSFKLCKTSLIHLSYDGGKACFQLSKINRLASRVQKAKECCASAVRVLPCEIPKRADKGFGFDIQW